MSPRKKAIENYRLNPFYFAGMYKSTLVDPTRYIVGNMPGPKCYKDYIYVILAQERTISPKITAVHTTAGLNRIGTTHRLWIHRIFDLFRGKDSEGKMIFSPTAVPAEKGSSWAQGNVFGMRAHTFTEEMEPKFIRGAVAMFPLPVENFDELMELAEMELKSEESVTKKGPYWQYEGSSCADLTNKLMSKAKIAGGLDLKIQHPQSLREHYRVLEKIREAKYMRYFDSEETEERVRIFNAFLDQHLNRYFISRGEAPMAHLPLPQNYNQWSTKYDPGKSLTDKDLKLYVHLKKLFDPSEGY